MHHNIYDRFQGCWWGGILGQSLITGDRDREDIVSTQWLRQRREISKKLLARELKFADAVTTFLSPSSERAAEQKFISLDEDSLLALLPLIIFGADDEITKLKYSNLHNPSATDIDEKKFIQDLLVWSRLIYAALNYKFSLSSNRLQIDRLFADLESSSSLVSQLKLVLQGINSGISLHQLNQKLGSTNNRRETAIALSWYCFATTPRDYSLSIQRAIRVEPQAALLTAALTGTLSGAYNGMTRIFNYGRSVSVLDKDYQIENDLFCGLFNYWSGVYADEASERAGNLAILAIAPPRFIQTRLGLKIISQSNLDN